MRPYIMRPRGPRHSDDRREKESSAGRGKRRQVLGEYARSQIWLGGCGETLNKMRPDHVLPSNPHLPACNATNP